MFRTFCSTKLKAVFAILIIGSPLVISAAPKMRVKVQATEDRHITFADGGKLFHGMELSYLLAKSLFDSGYFQVEQGINNDPSRAIPGVVKSQATRDSWQELKERLPQHDFSQLQNYMSQVKLSLAQPSLAEELQITIQPRVKTLLYASGARSNRIVYGFSPDRENPYNEGREESTRDNEFVTPPNEQNQCPKIDFFSGSLTPEGWGPYRSNFGANFDEGIVLQLFGFGIGYKKKPYETKSEIEFDVENLVTREKHTYAYPLRAAGKDLFLGAAYGGVFAAVELQRRKTLRQALSEILPQITQTFIADLKKTPWQTSLVVTKDQRYFIAQGARSGIEKGMWFASSNGNQFAVVQVYDTSAELTARIDNPYAAQNGDVVRWVQNMSENPWQMQMAAQDVQKPVEQVITIAGTSSQDELKKASFGCFDKKLSWFEKLILSFSTAYGYFRYHQVFDQNFDGIPNHSQDAASSSAVATNDRPVRVAMVASGVFPKEQRIRQMLDSSGFDFLSWDQRPSDDLGMGTAAALLMAKSVSSKDAELVPFRVVGPQGETHSSAIFAALEYIAKRKDIDVVMIPFVPQVDSRAIEEGAALLSRSGKKVVLSKDVKLKTNSDVDLAEVATNEFKDHSLGGTKVKLSRQGVGVVDKTVEIIKKLRKGVL